MKKNELAKLRSLIRRHILEILEEDCCEKCGSECKCDTVDEINKTSNVDGYQTPFAFDDNEDEETHAKNIKDVAQVFDYTTTNNIKKNTIKEGKSLYHILRDHPDLSEVQKVGTIVRRVNKMLDEINLLLGLTTRLKNESNINNSKYWKTTNRFLTKADIKIKKISETLRNLR